jgi:dipeptidyl aminopeptidase/acylaminoacyl peptidase
MLRFAVFVVASAAFAAPTIEQLLSVPFPSELTAAPGGGRAACVVNERGARNVWVAEAPNYEPRRVTSFTADDGVEIGQLAWSADGKTLFYTRGGDLEMGRSIPNPNSRAEAQEQAIWSVTFPGGTPQKLTEGHSPVPSPKGDRVLFVKGGQIWSAPWPGTTANKPAQLIHAKGGAAHLRFSPDGTALAFVSARGDHSFIGLYRFADQNLRYLDASVDRDQEPTWSPDSKRIAFIRIPASTRAFTFGPEREGQPWSIRMADVASGASREIWRAQPGMGSVFSGGASESQLLWAAGDRLVFPWERDGWRHLYSVRVTGSDAVQLTKGEFEVEHAELSLDGKNVLLASNQGDIDRRHIWQAPVDGSSTPRALTSGTGIEWTPVDVGNGSVIFFASDARQPAHPVILTNGTRRDLVPGRNEIPAAELVDPQQVIFPAADGLSIHGQLFLPRDLKPGEKRSAIVFYHGGSRRQMLLGWHYRGYYSNTYAINQYFASKGYIVLSVNYRSGTGYGMQFREALHYGATGASEFQDVIGAALYLKSRPDVARIGVYGGSYGGYLTAMALSRASGLYAAGVDIHGVHDWNNVIRNFVPAYDPLKQAEAAKLAYQSSPISSVSTWRSPVLLIHGDDDRNVPFNETVLLVEALRKQNVEFEQLVLPDEVHDFLTFGHWLQVVKAAENFFDRKLPAR